MCLLSHWENKSINRILSATTQLCSFAPPGLRDGQGVCFLLTRRPTGNSMGRSGKWTKTSSRIFWIATWILPLIVHLIWTHFPSRCTIFSSSHWPLYSQQNLLLISGSVIGFVRMSERDKGFTAGRLSISAIWERDLDKPLLWLCAKQHVVTWSRVTSKEGQKKMSDVVTAWERYWGVGRDEEGQEQGCAESERGFVRP